MANRISTQRLFSRFDRPLIIHPFYHTVSNGYLPHLTPLYKPPTFGKFKEDLDFLLRYFQAVDAEDVWLHTTGEKRLAKDAFHLSFDDGLKEVYTEVMPYLYRKGIPATVFITNDFVNNTQLFYRHKAALLIDALTKRKPSPAVQKTIEMRIGFPSKKTLPEKIGVVKYPQREVLDEIASLLEIDFEQYLQNECPYLTMKQLFEMRKKGFSIGGQGIDHQPFSGLSEEEQVRQIVSSIGFVKRIAPDQHRYFAFPDNDEAVPESVFQTIYRKSKRGAELTFDSGGIGTHYDGRHISRMAMEQAGRDAKEMVNRALLGAFQK
ncbi:MAG: polysaccharide deacetylase family protein [Dysgonamonadaceae bacterium]|nr:polysaccharide deacetylase family protein [Dysgonamonadaceae bacterium]